MIMETIVRPTLTITTTVEHTVDRVWNLWVTPRHILKWNMASPEWRCSFAENDLKAGGRFLFRMAAKDGSESFDYTGTYQSAVPRSRLSYTLDDGRKVSVVLTPEGSGTRITETFEAESTHTLEQQQQGWQAVLEHFKSYAEGHG